MMNDKIKMLTKNMSDEDADTFAFMFARLNATHEEAKRMNDINVVDFDWRRSQRVDDLCVEAEELHQVAFSFLKKVQTSALKAKLSL
jgi:hypothetical protein